MNIMLLKILAILLNIGDYITTIVSLKCGGKEVNPVIRWLLKHKLAFIVKVILGSFFIYYYFNDMIILMPLIIFGIACIHNLLLIRRVKKLLNKFNLEYKNGKYIFKKET